MPDSDDSTNLDETYEYKGIQVLLHRVEGYQRETIYHIMQGMYGHPIG